MMDYHMNGGVSGIVCLHQCSAVQCSAVQFSAVQCSAVQCSAVQCSAVQCSAVQCSTVQCSAVQWSHTALDQLLLLNSTLEKANFLSVNLVFSESSINLSKFMENGTNNMYSNLAMQKCGVSLQVQSQSSLACEFLASESWLCYMAIVTNGRLFFC